MKQGPYRGFDIFIDSVQGVCALERSHPGSDEEILILYRMSLQLYGVGQVKALDTEIVRDPRRTGYGVCEEGKELTFHIDSLFFAEGRAELLHLGCETMLGVSSGERVMLCGVGPGWWKRMIGR